MGTDHVKQALEPGHLIFQGSQVPKVFQTLHVFSHLFQVFKNKVARLLPFDLYTFDFKGPIKFFDQSRYLF